MWSGCTCTRPTMPSCSRSTRNFRSRCCNARNRSCRWTLGTLNAGFPPTCGMGQSILFAALNVATGEGIARWKPQYRGQDFVAFLRDVNACVEAEREVHVALDNLSVHKAPAVHRWLLRHPRFQFHFTPTYASWMNLVERFLGLLTAKALKRGSHTRSRSCDGAPRLRRGTQRTPRPLQVGQDRRRNPRQDAAVRTPRATGAWTVTGLILEITDPGG